MSFVQTRIKAASRGKLEIVNRYPTSQPFEETELIKTTHTTSQSVGGEVGLGPSPNAKISASATRTSGVDKTTNKWIVTPDIDEEVVGAVSNASAIWKYAHNDLVSDPVKKCTFNPKFHPRATFGFLTIKTEIEIEMTVFWSSNRDSRGSRGQLRELFPVWPRTKKSVPIFFNFFHRIAVVVDLEKIPLGDSWTMPEMKTDNVKMEDLVPSKPPVTLGRTTEIAQQYSGSGQIDDIVSTDCKVFIETAVGGKVELAPEDRTGMNTCYFSTHREAKIVFNVIGCQSVLGLCAR